jgi:hypothetical protein
MRRQESMSALTEIQFPKLKPQPVKAAAQVKAAAKPQPSGLSREEVRQIVIEMIG